MLDKIIRHFALSNDVPRESYLFQHDPHVVSGRNVCLTSGNVIIVESRVVALAAESFCNTDFQLLKDE